MKVAGALLYRGLRCDAMRCGVTSCNVIFPFSSLLFSSLLFSSLLFCSLQFSSVLFSSLLFSSLLFSSLLFFSFLCSSPMSRPRKARQGIRREIAPGIVQQSRSLTDPTDLLRSKFLLDRFPRSTKDEDSVLILCPRFPNQCPSLRALFVGNGEDANCKLAVKPGQSYWNAVANPKVGAEVQVERGQMGWGHVGQAV